MSVLSRHWLALACSVLICTCAQAQAQDKSDFATYPVTEHFSGKPAALRLVSKQDHEFRTALRRAAQASPNFAGHFILTSVGCGASCVMTAAIDAKTGKVAWLPFTLCCWDEQVREPIAFRLDSDLIILHGRKNEGESGTWMMRFVDGKFAPISARRP
jgi:hypothetical protein